MTNNNKPLHVIQLTAENFKRLKCVTIEPKGNMVQITGGNAQGKSSCIDALFSALGGGSQTPTDPIRHGAQKAKIKVDLGELIVTRNFTQSGTTLTIEDPEGRKFKTPQSMLDSIMGSLSFDPLAFTRKAAKDQAQELRRIAHIELDLDLVDSQIKELKERRKRANQEAKTAQAAADGIKIEPVGELIDTSALMDRLAEIGRIELENSKIQASHATLKGQIEEQKQRREKALLAIRQIDEWLAQAEPRLNSILMHANPTEDAITIRQHIKEAEKKNAVFQQEMSKKASREVYLKQAARFEAEAETFDAQIEAKEQAKRDALEKAQMPIPGLDFEEGVILYNGVRFDQASSAEQLRVSTAIAMAANPKLKVIRISDGSLLDSKNLAMLASMAEEGGYQIWIESVDESGKVGIFIEDGEVKADNQLVGPKITLGISSIADCVPPSIASLQDDQEFNIPIPQMEEF